MPRAIWMGAEDDYEENDPRLMGMGNPPSDPVYQAAHPGGGRFPMVRRIVGDAEVLRSSVVPAPGPAPGPAIPE